MHVYIYAKLLLDAMFCDHHRVPYRDKANDIRIGHSDWFVPVSNVPGDKSQGCQTYQPTAQRIEKGETIPG